MIDIWYHDQVVRGSSVGKELGFPTINLNPDRFIGELKDGVYSAIVEFDDQQYLGALYFGPKYTSNEKKYILEIHILNFNQTIYGKTVEFKIGEYIRGAKKFETTTDLKKQIKQDIEEIKRK